MRVIAGSLGGRRINAPSISSTHPMSEKIRGAIFSALGDIKGLSVLDVYSGSGALALEAFSRGAARVVAIESNPAAARVISSNLVQLGIVSRIKLIQAKVSQWQATAKDSFDLILADPPYLKTDIIELVNLELHLNVNGILVLSWPGNKDLPKLDSELIKTMNYGDAQLGFFLKKERISL